MFMIPWDLGKKGYACNTVQGIARYFEASKLIEKLNSPTQKIECDYQNIFKNGMF